MFKFIKKLFGFGEPATKSWDEPVSTEEKVENTNPVVDRTVVACGCGRSPIGVCVGLHRLSEEEWAVHEKNPNRVKPKAKSGAKKGNKKVSVKKNKKA